MTEAVPAGWQLNDASCRLQDGSPTGNRGGSTVGGITIQSGKVTTCTFKNSRQVPHIKVVKSLDRYTDADGQFLHGTAGSRSVPELLEDLERIAAMK